MNKYKCLKRISKDGKLCAVGSIIELTAEQAANLPVEIVKESKPKVSKPTADKE